jgi:hypothetical protein
MIQPGSSVSTVSCPWRASALDFPVPDMPVTSTTDRCEAVVRSLV